ncbi:hypothetical protein IAU60_003623 [Kwoniella sp. DSM 27419]
MSMFADVPTLDHYAFNLRDGLRKAAVSSLSELEQCISSNGYDWLDAHMQGIMNNTGRAPITELMKTPSRTQTVKKTRATAAAAKDRTDKVKGFNARLALSPVSKQSSSTRQVLSPLQPRSLNAVLLSPSPVPSPKTAPFKAKQPEKEKDKSKAKAPGKKTRSKKTVDGDENTPPSSASVNVSTDISAASSLSAPSRSTSSGTTKKSKSADKEKSKSTRSKKAAKADKTTVEEPMEVDVADDDRPNSTKNKDIVGNDDKGTSFDANRVQDEAELIEGERREGIVNGLAEAIVSDPAGDTNMAPSGQSGSPAATIEAQPASQSIPPPPAEPEREHKVDPTMPSSFAIAPAKAPMRQVRSSWLSKALGATTVPLVDSTLRKSSAAPAQQRPSSAMDFTGLRKSLAPIGGMKRKSEQGLGEDEDDMEEKRPEKTSKMAAGATGLPEHTNALPARTPGPSSRPNMPTKTPSYNTAENAQPGSHGRSAPSSSTQDSQRSDIHKVTRALDELREKTAAKELAKQKALAAVGKDVSGNAGRVPQAKSTGTGFLRGLGNIGAGLLGLGGVSAEEEAQRLAEELEQEQRAEQELERLVREATQPEQAEEADKDAGDDETVVGSTVTQPNDRGNMIRSTTPDISPPTHARPPMTPEEEEEMIEEQSVIEELLPADSRESEDRKDADRRSAEHEAISTTPTGTPTKARPARPLAEAPAVHARTDKHEHEPSAARQKGAAVERNRDHVMEVDGEEASDNEDTAEPEPRPKTTQDAHKHRKTPSSAGVEPPSLATSAGGSVLSQAQLMASKALGVRPSTEPVKSVQLAAAAARKEQATIDRKAQLKEAEARRQLAAKKKAEEDRVRAEEERARADEERRAKVAELEEKRRQRLEFEKRQRQREEKTAAALREKAEKERMEKEAQAAKMRAAEEEAARKRKAAAIAALNKSQNAAKKVAGGPSNSLQQSTNGKGKEPFRPTKQSSAFNPQPVKNGPSVFRTAETHHQTTSSTITLITQQPAPERKALGPPSRPSAMAQHSMQPMRQSTAVHQSSSVLQQGRVALQAQLDEKAAMIQSEDIELPDIASEYSDSDDEDKTKDFIPPTWAESPQLRAALEAQATRDPDELFGPIKPLNMEELFKVRTNKFRARTSSANWHKGDGLTKAEEVEYAKRMGFKPVGSSLAHGGGW